MIEQLRDLLTKHEGLRLKPYKDTVGKLTIGVGRNLEDVGISKEEALFLLENDIARVVAQCRQSFLWFDFLSPERQAAIANMVFNLGLRGFMGFKNMIAAIEKGDFDMAAIEMLDSEWSAQVGKRATELSHMIKDG